MGPHTVSYTEHWQLSLSAAARTPCDIVKALGKKMNETASVSALRAEAASVATRAPYLPQYVPTTTPTRVSGWVVACVPK